MTIKEEQYLAHYGMPRRSGRYPYGSGDEPFQSTGGNPPAGWTSKEYQNEKNNARSGGGGSTVDDPRKYTWKPIGNGIYQNEKGSKVSKDYLESYGIISSNTKSGQNPNGSSGMSKEYLEEIGELDVNSSTHETGTLDGEQSKEYLEEIGVIKSDRTSNNEDRSKGNTSKEYLEESTYNAISNATNKIGNKKVNDSSLSSSIKKGIDVLRDSLAKMGNALIDWITDFANNVTDAFSKFFKKK